MANATAIPGQGRRRASQPILLIQDRQGERGESDDQQHHRALHQEPDADRHPEPDPPPSRGRLPRIFRHPGFGQPGHCGERHRQQHRVGLGLAGFDRQKQGRSEQQSGEQPSLRPEPAPADRQRQQQGSECADQRGNAVGPDRVGGIFAAGQGGGRGLQPVNPDRLLQAEFILEADVDEVPCLQHLPARLRKARLVPVDGRDRSLARQEDRQPEQQDHQIGQSRPAQPEADPDRQGRFCRGGCRRQCVVRRSHARLRPVRRSPASGRCRFPAG